MARISSSRRGDATCVTVRGKLAASDMGRFEHACAPALIDSAAALEIDLRGVTALDRTAKAVLRRMVTRGARIRFPAHLAAPLADPIDASMVPERDGA